MSIQYKTTFQATSGFLILLDYAYKAIYIYILSYISKKVYEKVLKIISRDKPQLIPREDLIKMKTFCHPQLLSADKYEIVKREVTRIEERALTLLQDTKYLGEMTEDEFYQLKSELDYLIDDSLEYLEEVFYQH